LCFFVFLFLFCPLSAAFLLFSFFYFLELLFLTFHSKPLLPFNYVNFLTILSHTHSTYFLCLPNLLTLGFVDFSPPPPLLTFLSFGHNTTRPWTRKKRRKDPRFSSTINDRDSSTVYHTITMYSYIIVRRVFK